MSRNIRYFLFVFIFLCTASLFSSYGEKNNLDLHLQVRDLIPNEQLGVIELPEKLKKSSISTRVHLPDRLLSEEYLLLSRESSSNLDSLNMLNYQGTGDLSSLFAIFPHQETSESSYSLEHNLPDKKMNNFGIYIERCNTNSVISRVNYINENSDSLYGNGDYAFFNAASTPLLSNDNTTSLEENYEGCLSFSTDME